VSDARDWGRTTVSSGTQSGQLEHPEGQFAQSPYEVAAQPGHSTDTIGTATDKHIDGKCHTGVTWQSPLAGFNAQLDHMERLALIADEAD